MIARVLTLFARHATRFLAGGVLLGIAFPAAADAVRPWLGPLICVTLVVSLVRLDFREVFAWGRRPALPLVVLAALILLSPVLTLWATQAAHVPTGIAAGIVLMAASTPITASPAIALMLGLDAALAVLVVVAGHAAVPFTLPTMSLWLLGLDLQIGALELMQRLAGYIAVSFALAWALLRWRPTAAWIARERVQLDGLAVLALVVCGVGIMAGVTDAILARPAHVALATVLAFVANAALQAAAAIAFIKAGRRVAFTVGLMAGNRNMGLILAALGPACPPDVALFFAVGQLPMYMLPMLALPIYRRLLHRRADPAARLD